MVHCCLKPAEGVDESFVTPSGRPIRCVEVLGTLVAVSRKDKHVAYALDDASGYLLGCTLWIQHEDGLPRDMTVPNLGETVKVRRGSSAESLHW